MRDGKRILAVIPARAGSKGLPDKNIRPINGIPLIGRAAQCLFALPWIDAAILSTDSEAYARVGRDFGLDVPFLRPDWLATDRASAVDMAKHALESYENLSGQRIDILLLIEPTSPLRQPEDIDATVACLIETGAGTVATVSPLPSHFHPDKVLATDAGGCLEFFTKRGGAIVSRQELSDLFIRNGLCYAATRSNVLERRGFVHAGTVPCVIDRPVANIDTALDLSWAEFLLGPEDGHSASKT